FFDRRHYGDILSHFTSDLDNILQAFNESLIQVMSNIVLYIGLILVMFSRNVTLALITIASTPLAFLM
ncbi:ABC transporter ATP-binding protein, partial [Streptococcus pneumoniae]|nr:ABC transporter ATP-binding protein [Streptococcus pneumoniae]